MKTIAYGACNCFSGSIERIYNQTNKTQTNKLFTRVAGLTKRSRNLLSQCSQVDVRLVQLKTDFIDTWTRPKPKQAALLRPCVQRSIASLPPSCTISLAPIHPPGVKIDRPIPSPSLVITRPGVNISSMKPKSMIGKSRTRSPPGLVPLITNAWSLKANDYALPKTNSLFILPDVVPVMQSSASRAPNQVVIEVSPSKASPTVASPKSTRLASMNNVVVVDLCSSGDELVAEDLIEEAVETSLPPTFVIPPGISITKVDHSLKLGNSHHKERSKSYDARREPNNNRAQISSFSAKSNAADFGTSQRSVDPLAIMPNDVHIKQELAGSNPPGSQKILLPEADEVLPIVTPLKLGRLPLAKREQMKQSLLKIQKKEGKSPPSVAPLDSPLIKHVAMDSSQREGQHVNLDSHLSRDLSNILSDECKELKDKGLDHLMHSDQRTTRRKRSKDDASPTSPTHHFHLTVRSAKMPKMDHNKPGPSVKLVHSGRADSNSDLGVKRLLGDENHDSNDYSNVIVVDVAGVGRETLEDSISRSSPPSTPDSLCRLTNKKAIRGRELQKLLGDECKELRLRGLENLSHSNERVTRCRTKSAPIAANRI